MDTPTPGPILTPGGYLRLRRQAAGMSVDDVAFALETEPHWPAIDRAQWLSLIEVDVYPVSPGTAIALHACFAFDPMVLDALIALFQGLNVTPPPLCRRCALLLKPISRAVPARDLCSACAATRGRCPSTPGTSRPVSPASLPET
jgi:hypothetical protein